jgi:hypothetical protein
VRHDPARWQVDFARVGDEVTAQRREQARLAAAVRADEPDLVTGVHRQARVFEQAPRAAREREVRDANHRSGYS